MTFIFPESVKSYYEDAKIRESVDALLEKLDGCGAFENIDRNEARSYNQALLAAAQVRADYVELLFNFWEETFGKAIQQEGENLREEFLSENNAPKDIWKNGSLRSYVEPKRAAGNKEFYWEIWVRDDGGTYIYLESFQYDISGDAYIDFEGDFSGPEWDFWSVERNADNISSLTGKVPFTEFSVNPDIYLPRLQVAANTLIRHLSQSS